MENIYTVSMGINPLTMSKVPYVKNEEFSICELQYFLENPQIIKCDFHNEIERQEEITRLKRCVLPWWSGAHFKDSRSKANLIKKNILTLDIDYGDVDIIDTIKSKLKDIMFFLHSTINYSPNNHIFKYRLVLPLRENISSELNFYNLTNYIINLIGDKYFDLVASRDIARASISPSVIKGEKYLYIFNRDSEFLDIYLHDTHQMTECDITQITVKKRRLPSTLNNIEGVFCKKYTCVDIMNKYAPKEYRPDGDPLSNKTRWTYTQGTSKSGIRFEDNGELLHCEHESSPLVFNKIKENKKQWSAYDLYVFFAHNGDERQAINAIEDELYSATAKKYITSSDFSWAKSCKDSNKVMEFIKTYTFLFVSKTKIYFVFFMKENNNINIQFYDLKVVYALFGNHFIKTQDDKEVCIYKSLSRSMPACTNIVFYPFNPITEVEGLSNSNINTFTGFVSKYVESDDENEGVRLFKDYVLNILCSGHEETCVWVLDWVADIVQYPREKKGTAIVMYSSREGVGKSRFFDLLKATIFGSMAVEVLQDNLTNNFNSDTQSSLLVFCDEANYNMQKDQDKLKLLITSETKRIELKGVDPMRMADYTRYIIASNHNNFLKLDPKSEDRRYTVLHVKDNFKNIDENRNYFINLTNRCLENKNEIFSYFLKREITSDLRMRVHNKDYIDMAISNQTPIDCMLNEILESTWAEINSNFNSEFYTQVKIFNDYIAFSKESLLMYYNNNFNSGFNVSLHKFSKLLLDSNGIDMYSISCGNDIKNMIGNRRIRTIRIPIQFFTRLNEKEGHDQTEDLEMCA